MKKLILTISLFVLFLGISIGQYNPDYIPDYTVVEANVDYFSKPDTAVVPEVIFNFPPLSLESDTAGYVRFEFNKPYPYFKYINGTNVLLMTSDQSRLVASSISDYSIMDSILVSYNFKNAFYLDLIEQKDSSIVELEGIIIERDKTILAHNSILVNNKEIIEGKDKQIQLLKDDIITKNKSLRKQKWIIGGSIGIAIGVPLVALIFSK